MTSIKHILFTMLLTLLFLGCDSKDSSSISPEQETPKNSAAGLFTAGDDQSVLEGGDITLKASILDESKVFEYYIWREHSVVLGREKDLNTDSLSVGVHTITLEAVDQDGVAYTDTIIITIKKDDGTNTPPIAHELSFSLEEDNTYTTALSGSDADGDKLSYLLVSHPKNGTLSGSFSRLHYTPKTNFFGEDSFEFKLNDGNIDSNIATVTIMIDAINDTPVAVAQTVTIEEDTPQEITLIAKDVETEVLQYLIKQAPINGTYIDGVYTPKPNFSGEDSFTFLASDGEKESQEVSISITINAVNDPTIFNSIPSITSIEEENFYSYDINVSDVDSDVTLSLQTEHSWLQLEGNRLFGTPKYNDIGTKKVRINAFDGEDTSTQTFSLTVININHKPRFTNTAIMIDTDEDNTSLEGQFTAQDDDNDTLIFSTLDTLEGFTLHEDGRFDLNLTSDFYQALNPDENITKRFLIKVIDEVNTVDEQNLTIMIKGINDAPIANNDTNSTDEDTTISFNLLSNDTDLDHNHTLTVVELYNSEYNTTLTSEGTLTFSPVGDFDDLAAGAYQDVLLTYLMKDEHNATSEANVTITITGLNDPLNIEPTMPNDANLSDGNGTIFGTVIADDLDDAVIFTDTNMTNNGFDINATTGVYTYTPPAGTYDYLAEGESTTIIIPIMINDEVQDITITIIGKNDAPSLETIQTLTIHEDDSNATGRFMAFDDNLSSLTYTATPALSGFTMDSNGNYQFDPSHDEYQSLKKDEQSIQTISITVDDGEFNQTEAFTIMITGINDAPIAHYDYNETTEDANITFNLFFNDIDVDNNHTFTLLEVNPTEGNVSFTRDGNFTFSPIGFFDSMAKGTEQIVNIIYLMEDEHEAASEANITMIIRGVNDAPTIDSLTLISIDENITTATGQIVASDAENSTLTFTSNNPLITIDSNGTYTFNTNNDYNALAEGESEIIPIMITISDGDTNITKEINVTIIGVNTPPVLELGNNHDIAIGETLNIGISSVADIDGNISLLQYSWLVDGTEESVSNALNYTFTQAKSYTIQLTVTDDKNATATDSLNVTVHPAPTGEMTFIPHTVTMNAVNPEWLEIIDLDKDGDLDILSAGDAGTKIAWYQNKGDFTFAEHIIATTGTEPESIKAADMDKDGDLDILYTTYDGNGASLMQCLNDSKETFTCRKITNKTLNPVAVANLAFIELVDINNDNYLDIVSASWTDSRIDWYENLQDGNYSAPTAISTSMDKAISLDSADIDGDGDMDIIAAANANSKVQWYRNDNNGASFIKSTTASYIPGAYSVDIVDINKDGKWDAISTSHTDSTIYIHDDINTTLIADIAPLNINLSAVYYASGADMDNDGDIDIVSNSYEVDGRISWYENNESSTAFTEHNISTGVTNIVRVFPADIDNDGNMDIVSCAKNGNITFYENPSTSNEMKLPKTGQTVSLYTGDDGDTQAGAERSYSTENDLYISENHTGLIWQDDSDVRVYLDDIDDGCSQKSGLYNDWRVPTYKELFYLIDKGSTTAPLIDSIFSNKAVDTYWADYSNFGAYHIDFATSVIGYELKKIFSTNDTLRSLRCVRGESSESRYIREDVAEVVKDQIRKIMWQDDSATKNTTTGSLEEAINYCNSLNSSTNYDNWRIPNIHEQKNLREKLGGFPSIFQNTTSKLYWSSTQNPINKNIYKEDFSLTRNSDEATTYVRCIRDIP